MTDRGTCLLNDQTVALAAPDRGLVLGWLRERRGLAGTKEGCGEGECGACTVLIGERDPAGRLSYRAVAGCLLPVGELPGRHVVTVEGLNPSDGLNPIQQSLVDAGAPQCGFCFPGIVVSLAGFFLTSTDLSADDAMIALDGNICRCTGYASIRRAIEDFCSSFAPRLDAGRDRVEQLVEWGVLPEYFGNIAPRLAALPGSASTVAPSEGLLLAGGTDLLIQQPDLLELEAVDYVSRRRDLVGITRELDHVSLGAATTIEDLKRDPAFRSLVPGAPAMIERFGSTIIRNRATVAGNLVNASPIGDVTVLLLALGSELVLSREGKRRTLPLGDFYLGYKQLARKPGEIIEAVRVPATVAACTVSFEKISQRRFLDIASVNSAACARMVDGVATSFTLAIGGVAPVPLPARRTSAFLTGRTLDAATIHEAAGILDAEIDPIDDVRGSALYKRELARRVLFAHALAFAPGRVRLEELI